VVLKKPENLDYWSEQWDVNKPIETPPGAKKLQSMVFSKSKKSRKRTKDDEDSDGKDNDARVSEENKKQRGN
jgi:hypothetical protein